MHIKIFFAALSILMLAGLISYRPPAPTRQSILQKKQRSLISCPVDRNAFDPTTNTIPLLPGWGAYRMPVTAHNDSSYIYFQQGINLYYGFHIIEALASFDKSTKFDSSFAMGYWGVALAYGPNINDLGYAASPKALAAAQKAKELAEKPSAATTATPATAATTATAASPATPATATTTTTATNAASASVTPTEKALIEAIQSRYSNDPTKSRQQLDQDYADAMRNVYNVYPQNQDVAALYADALMQQHPWDLYDRWGKPKNWTPTIVQVLEASLKINPKHPGAAHYYIHAVEASDHPERAMAVSNELPDLMPGVSHVVHMPSHIYIRTGNYDKGWTVNTKAVQGYAAYLSQYPSVAANAPLYLLHNLHMEVACASMDGRYADAYKASVDTKKNLDTSWLSIPGYFGTFVQYVYMTPLATQLRFGKWDEIIKDTPINASYVYADIITHFCRGVAYARKGRIADAQNQLVALQKDTTNKQLFDPAPNYSNPGINGTRVAEKILAGSIAEARHDWPQSIALLQQAVEYEDAMTYNEPRDWLQPARQFLGNVQLKAGQYKAAEQTYRDDLQANPQNGWSYTGLATALTKQGKENATAKDQAQKAFARSDNKITTSVVQ
jgi:tetratricopeptide (TPR) repeat protein